MKKHVCLLFLILFICNCETGYDIRNDGPDYSGYFKPTWSPDASKVCFLANKDGIFDIYIANIDGSNPKAVFSGHINLDPEWSPLDNRIVFASDKDNYRLTYNIFVVDSDGENLVRLTVHSGIDTQPAWSPDGTEIAYISNSDGHRNIFIINSDGSNQRSIARQIYGCESPTWSPDCSKIAFVRDYNEIYTINSDGSELQLLFSDSAHFHIRSLSWSPENGKIAFSLNNDIYTINSDGTEKVNLTNTYDANIYPDWSPDGSRLINSYYKDEIWHDIYIMNADGSNPRKIEISGVFPYK